MCRSQLVRSFALWPLLGGVIAFVCGQSVALVEADAHTLERRFTFWGRFQPGSWVVVRHEVESLDPMGRVVASTNTETRTTLAGIEDQHLRLQVQASLEVGGKRLNGPTQELRQGPGGENPDIPVVQTDLGREDVQVQDRVYSCEVEQRETVVDGRRTIDRIWRSSETVPAELRRRTTVIDVETGRTLDETVVEVVSLSRQRRILARFRPIAELRIVHRSPRGSIESRAVNCPEVPGGVVSQTSEEFDADGTLVRRAKIELVDFETK